MGKATRKPGRHANHRADIKNANKGTTGNNIANAKANGNRGKQLNPNQKQGK